MKEELTKIMTDSYDQGVKDALESIKEGLDALPKREWVGLTEDELLHIGVATGLERAAAQMIEAKLKEKNT